MKPRVLAVMAHPDDIDFSAAGTIAGWTDAGIEGAFRFLNRYWRRLYDEFPEFQFVLCDEDEDVVLGEGHTIPCAWDGTPEGLPAGIDGMIEHGFRLREEGGEPTALSAMAIEIRPEAQGGGLSRAMLEGMREIARRHGLGALLAPVRPSWKERYPLTSIERRSSASPRRAANAAPGFTLMVSEAATPPASSLPQPGGRQPAVSTTTREMERSATLRKNRG